MGPSGTTSTGDGSTDTERRDTDGNSNKSDNPGKEIIDAKKTDIFTGHHIRHSHAGNIAFRILIYLCLEHRKMYVIKTKGLKLLENIVRNIENKGGRFLIKHEGIEGWKVADQTMAIARIRAAFKNFKRKVHNEEETLAKTLDLNTRCFESPSLFHWDNMVTLVQTILFQQDDVIKTPSIYDVLICPHGMDFENQTHFGNIAFRELIKNVYTAVQMTKDRTTKGHMYMQIACGIFMSKGKFLKMQEDYSGWKQTDIQTVKDKICSAIRNNTDMSTSSHFISLSSFDWKAMVDETASDDLQLVEKLFGGNVFNIPTDLHVLQDDQSFVRAIETFIN